MGRVFDSPGRRNVTAKPLRSSRVAPKSGNFIRAGLWYSAVHPQAIELKTLW